MGLWTFAWICCPQLPYHPCKTGTHSTCFYSTGGHTPTYRGQNPKNREKRVSESENPVSRHSRQGRSETQNPHVHTGHYRGKWGFSTQSALFWGGWTCVFSLSATLFSQFFADVEGVGRFLRRRGVEAPQMSSTPPADPLCSEPPKKEKQPENWCCVKAVHLVTQHCDPPIALQGIAATPIASRFSRYRRVSRYIPPCLGYRKIMLRGGGVSQVIAALSTIGRYRGVPVDRRFLHVEF